METKWIKWIKTAHRGLRYYEHPTRRHGKKKDRYYTIRFKVGGVDYGYGIGWWSDGIPEEARQDNPDMGFEEYALTQMKVYKANVKAGSGPKSPKEKRKLAREKEVQALAKKEVDARENTTFTHFFDEIYYPIAKTHKKRQTYIKEEIHFRLWIGPIVGRKAIKDVTYFDMERVKRKILNSGRSPRTAQYVMATARQIWNMARRSGFVTGDSPTRNVKVAKFDNRRQRFLSHNEVDALLKHLKVNSKQVYQMSLLAIHTGLRASEIFHLTWGCIDTERSIITILDAKSGKGRTAFMTEPVKVMFLDMVKGKNGDLVFPNKLGLAYTEIPHSFRDAVKDLKFNDDVSDTRQRVCFHSLRHTFGSWHAEAGTDLYVIKELMGHGSITLTERYSHLSQGTLQSATRNLEQSIVRARKDKARKFLNS